MLPESFPLDAYLARVGLTQKPSLNACGLSRLMRAQLFNVPFENTYVQAGLEVSLEPADIVDKIINQGRGGYCYEVNGLFAWAAEALGFTVRLIGARPMFYAKRWAKTHMAVLVELPEGRFFCDTGFGRFGLRAPLPLKADLIVQQDWDQFRLSKKQHEWVVEAFSNGAWEAQFSFDDSPAEWVDFMPANYFNSHSPEAIFVQKLLIIQHKIDARVILLGDTLKIIRADGVEECTLTEPVHERLARFGLTWPSQA
jgi:N-hydroxyarylamine O-acetyltransferase